MANRTRHARKVANGAMNASNSIIAPTPNGISFHVGVDTWFFRYSTEFDLFFFKTPDLEWICKSLRYTILTNANGSVPTAAEMEGILLACDLISTFSPDDRGFYLLQENTDAEQKIVYFYVNNMATGVTVLKKGRCRYLYMVSGRTREQVRQFYEDNGFAFDGRVTDWLRGVGVTRGSQTVMSP